VDQGNARVTAQAQRDFLKASKVKEHDTDKVEYEAFAVALEQGGPQAATRVLGMLPGGAVPKRFKDLVASGQRAGAPDTLQSLQTYGKIKDNPDLAARIWEDAADARAIRESYTRLDQMGLTASLQPLPAGSPPEVEKQYVAMREKAAKELALLAAERKARDGLADIRKTVATGAANVASAQKQVRSLTADTYGSDLSPISRAKVERWATGFMGRQLGHDEVSAPELVKQVWPQVQDSLLPVGTKHIALPLPGTPSLGTLGLSGLKQRSGAAWDKALLAALSEKGGGAAYTSDDIKEVFYSKGQNGAQLTLHVLSKGKLHTVSFPEFDVRKHIKE
jgi:hypothetical protein